MRPWQTCCRRGRASTVAAEARISIERIDNHDQRHAMEVAYDPAGLATPVAEGDLVRVFSIVPKYKQTVTTSRQHRQPRPFAWHPGMRLSDLIPDKESLITRNYWWKRTQLGLPAPEFEPCLALDECGSLLEISRSPCRHRNRENVGVKPDAHESGPERTTPGPARAAT